ncbi:MAG: hypothetical protein SWY16_26060 [Cyanobacteriota bacterium]|nr:hypothetical protein [Cyanobacteriota bacterium]
MTGPAPAAYRVLPPPPSTVAAEGGLSGNQMVKVLGTGKRQLMRVRDNPETLARFCLERIGKVYEYRDGKYYPVEDSSG